jgi:hypothetical protein
MHSFVRFLSTKTITQLDHNRNGEKKCSNIYCTGGILWLTNWKIQAIAKNLCSSVDCIEGMLSVSAAI